MSRAPRLTRKELIAALNRAGYAVVRVRGSHYFLGDCDLALEDLLRLQ